MALWAFREYRASVGLLGNFLEMDSENAKA